MDLSNGFTTDVALRVTTKVDPGEVWPMLHRDTGQPGVSEWPGGPDGSVRARPT